MYSRSNTTSPDSSIESHFSSNQSYQSGINDNGQNLFHSLQSQQMFRPESPRAAGMGIAEAGFNHEVEGQRHYLRPTAMRPQMNALQQQFGMKGIAMRSPSQSPAPRDLLPQHHHLRSPPLPPHPQYAVASYSKHPPHPSDHQLASGTHKFIHQPFSDGNHPSLMSEKTLGFPTSKSNFMTQNIGQENDAVETPEMFNQAAMFSKQKFPHHPQQNQLILQVQSAQNLNPRSTDRPFGLETGIVTPTFTNLESLKINTDICNPPVSVSLKTNIGGTVDALNHNTFALNGNGNGNASPKSLRSRPQLPVPCPQPVRSRSMSDSSNVCFEVLYIESLVTYPQSRICSLLRYLHQ